MLFKQLDDRSRQCHTPQFINNTTLLTLPQFGHGVKPPAMCSLGDAASELFVTTVPPSYLGRTEFKIEMRPGLLPANLE